MLSHRSKNRETSQHAHGDEIRQLVLHNDDFNTFDHVIESLQEVCGHNRLQAEQCAVITHTRGLCDIKHGSYLELENMYELLSGRHLTVTIE